MNLPIDTLRATPVSMILPPEWRDWVWTAISEGAPFSWGDNNHSLVDPLDFGDHLQDVMEVWKDDDFAESDEAKRVFEILTYLHQNHIFVDLEG